MWGGGQRSRVHKESKTIPMCLAWMARCLKKEGKDRGDVRRFSSWEQRSSEKQVSECPLMHSPDLTQHPWMPASWILLRLISTWTHHCYSESPLVDLIWFLWYITHFQAPGCFSSWSSTLVLNSPLINLRPSSLLYWVTHSALDPFIFRPQQCCSPELSVMMNVFYTFTVQYGNH